MHHTPSAGAARLALLQEIALALSGEIDRRRLCEGIVQGARRLLGAPVAAVLMFDPGLGQLVTEAQVGGMPHLAVAPGELQVCLGRAFLERTSYAVDGYCDHPRAPDFARELGLARAVATPLMRDGQALGVIFTARGKEGAPFDADELRLLEVLAGHMSLAIVNAQVLANATRRLAHAEELANALHGVFEARDREAILQRTLDCATTVLGADRAAVYLVNHKLDVAFVAGRRLSKGYLETVAAKYRRSAGGLIPLMRSPLFVSDITTDPRTRIFHELATREGIRSMLIEPLLRHDELLGAMALYHDIAWHYGQDELASARALADYAALAMATASLHQQTAMQLGQLRVLHDVVRVTSEPLVAVPEAERLARGAHAIVAGGAAASAWVFTVDDAGLVPAAHAGATALPEDAALDAARAALAVMDTVTRSPAGYDPLIAATIHHQRRALGVLVLSPPRQPPPELRPGVLFLELSEDPVVADSQVEFASTAAGQLAVAIASARLYSRDG